MSLFRKFFYKKPPDRLLEITERVYVFDCCFSAEALREDEFKAYVGAVAAELVDHFPEASFMVSNVKLQSNPGRSSSSSRRTFSASDVLSQYDMTVMDYPQPREGCPLLPLQLTTHFLSSSESWLSHTGQQQNVLLMHCDRGGWPVLAFLLAALLLHRGQYHDEQKALEAVYKQAPRDMLQAWSPMNPQASHLRYLRYIFGGGSGGSQGMKAAQNVLILDAVSVSCLPDKFSIHGMVLLRVYAQDPLGDSPDVRASSEALPKASDKDEIASVRIDLRCRVQGDVVIECYHLPRSHSVHSGCDPDHNDGTVLFRVMFHTAFVEPTDNNTIVLTREEVDPPWTTKDPLPRDFRAQISFSDPNAAPQPPVSISRADSGIEEWHDFDTGSVLDEFFEAEDAFNGYNSDGGASDSGNGDGKQRGANSPRDHCQRPTMQAVDVQATNSGPSASSGRPLSVSETSTSGLKTAVVLENNRDMRRTSSNPTLADYLKGKVIEQWSATTAAADGASQQTLLTRVDQQPKSDQEKVPEISNHLQKPMLNKIMPRWIMTPVKGSDAAHPPLRYNSSPDLVHCLEDCVTRSGEEASSSRAPSPLHRSTSGSAQRRATGTPLMPPPPPPPPLSGVAARVNPLAPLPPPPPPPPGATRLPPPPRVRSPALPKTPNAPPAPPKPPSAPPAPPKPSTAPPAPPRLPGAPPVPPKPPGAPPVPPKPPGAPPTPRNQCIPPPAPLKGLSSSGMRLARSVSPSPSSLALRKSTLKPLHWIKMSRVAQGTIWAELQKDEDVSCASEFDMAELESLFSANVSRANDTSRDKLGGRRRSVGKKMIKIHLIDLRRANNCEIMLTKVKIPLSDVMGAILSLDDSILDTDQVENLIKFCPTKEEMELIKGYTGDRDKLGKCEQYFFELMKVPRIEAKLRVFLFKSEFTSQISDLRRNLNILNSTCNEIRKSVKLKELMKTILFLGNTLNKGTIRGSAIGFRLDSLLKLTDTRATNNRMTLMHYLCKVISTKSPYLMDFHEDLVSLELASKIQVKSLAEEMQAIEQGLEKVNHELDESRNDGPISEVFRKTLGEFIVVAEAEFTSLSVLFKRVGWNLDALALYFGEDPAHFPFEHVTATLMNFVRTFRRAFEENCKMAEIERKKALRDAEIKIIGSPSRAKGNFPIAEDFG